MRLVFAALAAAVAAVAFAAPEPDPAAGAETVDEILLDVELNKSGVVSKRVLPMPAAAGKLFHRYLALADAQCPLTIMKSEGKGRDFAWIVGRDKSCGQLVFLTSNLTGRPRRICYRLSSKASLAPVYRRVVSDNRGRTWRRFAFEPPHFNGTVCASTSQRGRIEVPPYTVQVVIARLK